MAHEAGIIHRDIKPNNIMIDRQGKVKVMDFGLARSIIRSASVTQTGTYLGTPTYSSPEQCESSEIDGRSDIYSLGVVLYEMLSGRVPYEAETPFAIFKKIVDEDPIPLEKLNPTLSPQTIRFVQQMMAKKREDRYQTMAEVIRDIDLLLKTEIAEPETDEKRLAAAPTPAPHTPVDGKKLRTPARHRRLFVQRKRAPAWMAFGSIAALALIAVVGYLLIANKTISSPKPPVSRESTPKTADAPATPAKLPEKLTALIFDFQNLSPQEESRWLEIAISDLLIADLSQCDGLNVVSRINLLEGAKKIAGKRITLAEEDRVTLRKELGGAIDHLRGDIAVQGSFYIQEGKKIRIVASLFRCENGKLADWGTCQVDGENYEEGLLALVDALSIKIADAIRKRGADLKVASAERLTFDGGRPIGELMASLPATADKSRERKLADGLKEQDKAQRGRSEGFFGTAKAEVEGRSAAPGDAKPAAAGGVAQDPKKNDDDLTAEAGKSVSALAKDKAELQEEKAGEAKGDGNLMETLRARYRQLWEKEAVEFPR
ncbi:MAG: hypothetical protein A2Z34_05025 [Planctomycetes bacterium RBG_16_59_8]|nr:MAG: hypothetical protein A2Z34_05025 [Planctomycetes bacterium RBG_16_59_8]